MDNNNNTIFKYIVAFVADIYREVSTPQVQMYKHLLQKTDEVKSQKHIDQHVNVFREFVRLNKQAISERKSGLLNPSVIKFSDRVFICLSSILKRVDQNSETHIWTHLNTIMRMSLENASSTQSSENIDGTIISPAVARDNMRSSDDKTSRFISEIMDKVTPRISTYDVSNPAEAVIGLLSSGVLTDVITSVTQKLGSGDIDPASMMSSAMKMYADASKGVDGAPSINDLMSKISSFGSNS